MSDFGMAKLRIEQGHRVRFYQDFYGRQWVKVQGGLRFWRSGRIYLRNEEVISLKKQIAHRRASNAAADVGAAQTVDAA